MKLEEMVKCLAESLSLQATIASNLLEKLQSTEGAVILTREEIEPLLQSVILSTGVNREVMEGIALAVKQQEEASIPLEGAMQVLNDTLAKTKTVNDIFVDYIESIGKIDEFQKFFTERFQQ